MKTIGTEKLIRFSKKNSQRGATMLEYIAMAAMLLIFVWGAITALGGSLSGFLTALNGWVTNRTGQIPQ
ncbi:MAG TPA: Flp family type IVb pilin [Oligoflexia bacterium]|nr:Flp family type IVb pilin [Oligoflexia bacterium]